MVLNLNCAGMSNGSIWLSLVGSLRIGFVWNCSIITVVLSGFFSAFFWFRSLFLRLVNLRLISISASVLVDVVSSIESLIAMRLWYVSLVSGP